MEIIWILHRKSNRFDSILRAVNFLIFWFLFQKKIVCAVRSWFGSFVQLLESFHVNLLSSHIANDQSNWQKQTDYRLSLQFILRFLLMHEKIWSFDELPTSFLIVQGFVGVKQVFVGWIFKSANMTSKSQLASRSCHLAWLHMVQHRKLYFLFTVGGFISIQKNVWIT